jgi:tetratricopeptide (TPR) repeat protein/tRNA A-37 threonylcarbamoyl transferase component Bud32
MQKDSNTEPGETQAMPTPTPLSPAAAARERAGSLGTRRGEVRESPSGSGRLEVRCPNCHAPTEVAVDTSLTDLTCSSCGSHFSLVDQSKATRMAPPLSQMGRFELIERLGIGGFGSVWKARDKELDRTVAIKIPRQALTSDDQEKFFREARAAAQLRHPSIVSVHEVGRDGDSVYIVSDFVRGVTLGDWLTGQQLTSREAAELCAKIADALHHAHEQGVVHRDLKPANIMMDYDGEPHLMDFGLARRESGEVSITVDGQVLGTPAYMSPEQAQGEAHTADRRSDIYSLGVILFQLLTGELPFRGNARMLIKQVIQDEPPSPRKLNATVRKDLETITLKCLEKEPSRRYQSALELSAEIRRFLAGEPILARPIGKVQRGWRWCRRNPIMASLATAVLALMAMAVVILGISNAQIRRELQAALESANPDAAKGADYTVRQLLDDISTDLSDKLRGHPEAEAAIRATIGNAYQRSQLRHKAEQHLRAALEIRQRILGPQHPLVAQSKSHYAWYLQLEGKYSEGEQLLRQALAVHKTRKLENGDTMELRRKLHFNLIFQRRHQDAELVFREAAVIAERQAVPDEEFAIMVSDAGAAALELGDPVKSELLCRRAIELHRQVRGENHPEYGWAMNELGNALRDQNKLVEAEASYRAALANFRKNFGDSSIRVAGALTPILDVLSKKGDREGMEVIEKELYALINEQVEGKSHVDEELGHHMIDLALSLPMTGDNIGRKEKALAAAVRIYERATVDNPGNFKAWHYLAGTHRQLGVLYAKRLDEAEKAFRLAVALFDEHAKELDARPVNNAGRAYAYLALASFLADTDESATQEVADLCEMTINNAMGGSAATKNYVAWGLVTMPAHALRNPQNVTELAQQAVDAESDNGNYWNTLGVTQYRAGDFTKSIDSLTKSGQMIDVSLRPYNWFFLAMCHWNLDHKDEARKWYDRAVKSMEKDNSKNDELNDFRTEAAALLGIAEHATSDASSD